MMKTITKQYILIAFFFLGASFGSYAQLNLVGTGPTTTPAALVLKILGPGVNATNITYTGSAQSRGTFTSTATNLGMPSGVMLSSGIVGNPGGPASLFKSSAMNGNSDPQLAALVAPQLSKDAAVLEFDFTVVSDSVKFNYVFGSEEYNDYVNTSFNDVFGFFISGPGLPPNKNIAIVPGTVSTPVSINNINNGGPYGGLSSGPCTNCAYYNDNVNGTTVFLDGFTTVLEAKSLVGPCETYHIKLAISDVTDQVFDSGVFIEEGSFQSVGQIGFFLNGNPVANNDTIFGCPGGSVTLSVNPAANYNWSTGATTQAIVAPVPAVGAPAVQYSAFVTNPPFYTCFAWTTTVWVVAAPPTATITGNGSICTGFNTTLTANTGVNYLWSTGATTQSIVVGTGGNYTVTVSSGPGCSAVSTPFNVTVGSAVANITGPAAICSGAAANLQANVGTSYLWSNGQTTQNISVNTTGAYTVTVTQNGGCTATASKSINVASNPTPAIAGSNVICAGILTSFNAGAGYTNYQWSSGQTTQSITPLSTGNYTVTVTNASGCTGTTSQSLTINALPIPAITGTTSICQGTSTTLTTSLPYSNYAWTGGSTSQNLSVNATGTYTVTVTNVNGCTSSTSQAVVVNLNPTPTVTGTQAICSGNTSTFNGGNGFSTYTWSNGATTQTITIGTTGAYTVTVSNASGCTATSSLGLTVNNNPTTVVTGNTAICQGTNTTFNGGGGFNSYSWSNGATTQNILLTTAGTYTVTVSNASGCTGTSSNTLVVNANPLPLIGGTTAVCQGAAANLIATAGFSNYSWSNGATTQTIAPTTAGTFTVTVTDANGCSGTKSQAIVVNALPAPTVTGINAICAGSNTTFNANAGFASYQWSNGITTQSNTVTTAGTYTVTVTNANGCTGSNSRTLVVNANPTTLVTGTTAICQGTNTTFNGGAGFTGYSWSNGVTTQNNVLTTAGSYTVTVTDANGCTGTSSNTLVVNANPLPLIGGTTAVCQGAAANLIATAGFANYTWSNGATTQTIAPTTNGNFTVTVTDGNGCTGTKSQAVTINALPAPTVTGTNAICAGSNTTFNANAGFASYQWSNGITTQSNTVSTAGTYTVTVTNANGCTGSNSRTLVVNTNPTTVVTGTTAICQGTNTTFNGGAGFTGYNWSNGTTTQNNVLTTAGAYTVTVTDANGCTGTSSNTLVVNANPVPAITGITSICQGTNTTITATAGFASYLWAGGTSAQSLVVTASGNYTVTVTDGNGCTGTVSKNVIVNNLPAPSITGVTAVCQGSNASLNGGNGYAVYQWSTGSSLQTINPNTAGTFTVTVTDGNGCSGSTSANVVVSINPTPTITGVNTICQNTPTTFNAGSGYSNYSWSSGATTQNINPTIAGTYTVTVTNINGCTGTTTYGLTVNALPSPTITGVNSICQGTNTTFDAGAGFTSYQWSTGVTTQTVSLNNSGPYTVTVTNSNGCTNSANYNLTVNALPTPAIAGSNSICAGTTTNLDAGATYVGFQWSNGTSSQIVNTGIAGTYTVTVTDGNGCTGSTSQTLIVHANPTPAITGINVICQNTPTVFDGGAGFVNYNWSSGAISQTINPTTAGAYTVTVTDNNGCTGTTSYSLTVNALPTPTITGVNSICSGTNTTFDAGVGYTNYQWSTGSTSQTVSLNASGSYTVTVTDGNGCINSTSYTLTVNALPTPAIAGTNSICAGTSTNFDAGSGYSGYQWSDGSLGQIVNTGTSGIYTVTVTDGNGCTGSASQTLTVNANPTPAISGVNVICQNTPTVFDAGAGYSVYSWSSGNNTQTISPTISGNYTVTVTDANGCTGTTSYDLTVNPLPTPVISGINSICQNTSTTFDAGAGYILYQWSTGDASQTVSLNTGGTYTVTVTDGNGCINSTNYTLTVNALPTPTIAGTASICAGTTTNFDAGAGYVGYQWSNGSVAQIVSTGSAGAYTVMVTDGNGCTGTTSQTLVVNALPTPIITGNDTICDGFSSVIDGGNGYLAYEWNTGANSQTVTITTAGTYTMTVTDGNGCKGTTSFVLEVLYAEALITASGTTSFCDGDNVTLTANSGQSYLWSNGETTSSILVNSNGNYTVLVNNNNGCTAISANQNVSVHPYPVVRFTNDTSSICGALRVHFNNLSTFEPGSKFNWDFGDGGKSTIAAPTHDYTTVGLYVVNLTITSPYGCESDSSDKVVVEFAPAAIAKFSMNTNLVPLFEAKIDFLDQSINAYTWFWSFGDGDTSTLQNPSHQYSKPGTFNVKLAVTNLSGCLEEYYQEVTVAPFWIPNSFTPNGDGKNDLFFTSDYTLDVISFNMIIRNRWGQIVYETNDFNKPWNGSGKGSVAEEGTYVYDIYIKAKTGIEYNFKSTINLIR